MNILMIAPQPFFEPRGTPISVYQRLHALSALGHHVDLLTYHIGQDVVIPNVKIHRIPTVPFITNVKIGPSPAKLVLDILMLYKAIMLLLTNRYDVIHSHEEAAFMALFLAKTFRVKHLYDMHSSLPLQLSNFNFGNSKPIIKLFAWLEMWVLNTCNAVITIGADLEQYVYQLKPDINQIKIENLAIHAFDSSSNSEAARELVAELGLENNRTVVYTGTFEKYQGLDLLLESAAIVTKQQPDVLFLLVGGNVHQVERWRQIAISRQLENKVIFVGSVSPAKALVYLEIADILISPRTAGTSVPLKIYSYLHSGKPIIATKLPAHTHVLNDEISLLVDPNSLTMAEGILMLLGSPQFCARIGAQAQKFAKKHFNPTDYVAKVDKIYTTLSTSLIKYNRAASNNDLATRSKEIDPI